VNIEFDDKTHVYRVDGVEYLSVTRALKLAGLIDDSHFSPEAADRGTAIHSALHYYDEDDLDIATLPAFIKPYLDAWIKFKAESHAIIHEIEIGVASSLYQFAGRIDRVISLNDRLAVLDIKSGSRQDWHAIQTAGYQFAYRNGERLDALDRYSLYLSAESTYKLVPHENFSDVSVFLSALTVAKWRMAHQ
jgi:ATP-dependent exoDNAse (exonuclease V) beta subunit